MSACLAKLRRWVVFMFIMSDRKAVIKNADMSEDMQQDAVDCATQAMEKYNIEKDIAAYIKKPNPSRRAVVSWRADEAQGLEGWSKSSHAELRLGAFLG
ncbi:UNVERIFIED_CONTAM: hypothetical protein K2H54_036779 [Gekko kuhli]